jgi:putative aldouronate transport system substrate-binding protein
MVTRSSQSITNWGVSETCRNPEKAVQFLNLLYSDPETVNLLVYGVEGVHYEKRPDGTIGYPDGVDSGNSGYVNDAPYFLPNQFLEDVWEGNDPMLREKMKEYSESAKKSEALHFKLDDSGIAAGLSALNEIADQYAYGLETGQLDPDAHLAQMLEEMDGAGAGGIILEVQKQYGLYLAGK